MNKTIQKVASIPTLQRLPLYLRILHKMKSHGAEYASGAKIAQELGIDPIVVRKDLATTRAIGRPRLGFLLDEIIVAIEEFLGWSNTTDAFLVGAGHLGTALLGYQGFEQQGLHIVAAFDNNPKLIGRTVCGTKILDAEKLSSLAKRMHVQIGILTVTASVAQKMADEMVSGGIRGIWNFTPTVLNVPSHIILQREDLASSLAVLSHRLIQKNRKGVPLK